MRKLLLGFGLAVAALFTVAMTYPPAQDLVISQNRVNNELILGSKNTPVRSQGYLVLDRAILPGNTTILIDGGVGILGDVTINGTLTTTTGSTTTGSFSPALIDAGSVWVRGAEQVVGTLIAQQLFTAATVDAGTALFRNDVQFGGNVIGTSTTIVGDITLNGASPSVATATVRSGAKCVCTIVGGTAAIAAKGVACDVSSTTLTATSANAAAEHVKYICF